MSNGNFAGGPKQDQMSSDAEAMPDTTAPHESAGPHQFGGHPSQAHADHAAIMHAHGIVSDPHRMAAVHALHQEGGGLMAHLKKAQMNLGTKLAQEGSANMQPEAQDEAPPAAGGAPVAAAGKKKSFQEE